MSTTVNAPPLLLVEDSAADAALIQEMLPTGQFALQHVTSLADARAYITQNPVTVVLLDLSLPDGSGLDSFLSMLALAPDTPIIVLTGSGDDIAVQAVGYGAQDYLRKSDVTADTLCQSIRYAIERSKAQEAKLQIATHSKEIEAYYKLAMDASNTGIWSYVPATGKISTDEQIAKIWGLEPGAFGDNFTDFVDRTYVEDRAKVLQAIEAAIIDQTTYEFEHRIIWPDGSVRHILAKGSVYSDDTGNPYRMTGVCVDISNRKGVEERLKLALKGSKIGTWVREIETGKLIWDDQTHSLFGVIPGEFSLKFEDFLPLIVPEDVGEMLRATTAALEHASEYHCEFRILWPDGSIHFIESRGQAYHDYPLRMAGVCMDVTERRLSEQGLLQLAAIVESSEDSIISETLDGVILSWNQAAERMFGFSASEMIGRSISTIMQNGGIDELSLMMEKLKQGENIEHYESSRIRKDGKIIDVFSTLSPIRDSFGVVSGASAIVRDITKRKRLERFSHAQNEVTRILSESDSFVVAAPRILRLIAQTIHCDFGAFWCLDPDYLNLNEQLLRCVDVWPESDLNLMELAAQSKHLTFPVGDNFLGRVLDSGQPSWVPDLITVGDFARLDAATKGGLRSALGFPILVGTKAVGVVEFLSRHDTEPDNVLFDMMTIIGAQIGQFIDRSHAEEAARRSARARLTIGQAIMENAPVGVVWLDKKLVICEVNNEFTLQFGLDRQALLGVSITQIADIPIVWLNEVIEHLRPFSADSFPTTFGGALTPREAVCDLRIWPVKDEDGRPMGLIILTVEVTERVKLAKQRENFVATLTHDLKNPLIGQNRILEMILAGELGPLQGQHPEMLSLLKTGTDEMLQLIGTLLEVYRYEEGRPQLVIVQLDATQLIGRCLAQLNPIAQANGVTIASFFPDSLAPVFADEIALRRVLMNILDNAIKFTPRGGLVQVSCQSTESSFKITVQDSGAGMSEEEQTHLFQRFAQTGSGRKHKAGTGLGLYLCRQIAEAHGGKISCTSHEGSGTIISITLPAGERQPVAH